MYSNKKRIAGYIDAAIAEMELIAKMSEPIESPDDFGLSISEMTIFRNSLDFGVRDEEFPVS